MLAGLAVIVVVLFALQVVARSGWRTRLRGPDRRLMTVIETLTLPGATAMHVVRIADRFYVFGRTGTQIANLCEVAPDGIEAWLTANAQRDPVRPTPLARLAALLGPRV